MKLPISVWSSLGPLPVTVNPSLIEDNDAFGEVRWRPRAIFLDGKSCKATQVQTLWHELAHVAMWDGGVHNLLTDQQQEAVCDAIGSYLGGMQLAGYLTIRAPKDGR